MAFKNFRAKGLMRGLKTKVRSTFRDHQGNPLTDDTLSTLKTLFDEKFYLTKNIDVANSRIDPFEHFMSFGWQEGRDPNADFSLKDYAYINAEYLSEGENPFVHWIQEGQAKKLKTKASTGTTTKSQLVFRNHLGAPLPTKTVRAIKNLFDEQFYLDNNLDVANSDMAPLEHFMSFGWQEGRDPNETFSIKDYKYLHAEYLSKGENPVLHWLRKGKQKNLATKIEDMFLDHKNEPYPQNVIYEAREHFDRDFYLQMNEDIRLARMDPFKHFMNGGWREHRDPNPSFSINNYLVKNAGKIRQDINPLIHWVQSGCSPDLLANSQADIDFSLTRFKFTKKNMATIEKFFDSEFYMAQVSDVDFSKIDPLEHYLAIGWTQNLDPSPKFSTKFYLDTNIDIRTTQANPFEHYIKHGHAEKRDGVPYSHLRALDYEPLVSVIVPNYNHAKFLDERIASIENQTYNNIELILLDDCSTDNSRAVLNKAAKESRFKVKKLFNKNNAGNVFKQWAKGLSKAEGELIWICESDDFCEPNFLEHLVPHFANLSVKLAFGQIQFSDSKGNPMPGMDGFRENSEPGIWGNTIKRPAKEWFHNGFGVNNVMANVGGGVFRNQKLPKNIMDQAKTFKIAGDWYLYSHLANGGEIVFEPQSVSYFRQHDANTSATNFNKLYYYEELGRILMHNESRWGLPEATRKKFIDNVSGQWKHFGMEKKHGKIEKKVKGFGEPLNVEPLDHIVLAFLGFHSGGGELFPLHLANYYASLGKTVSMIAFTLNNINEDMLSILDSRVAVYPSSDIKTQGANRFLESIGASVVHSHMISLDNLFFNQSAPLEKFPYIVSLHGSHDTLGKESDNFLRKCLKGVTFWAYTADKNLKIFDDISIDASQFIKFENAMPPDNRAFNKTREELGIDPKAVIFTLVARGIQQKGWRAAIEAFTRLQKEKSINAHLLLVGNGPKKDELYEIHKNAKNITFLGFQSRINGIYRMSDCAIVPTRFDGESSPLCILQAMREGVPLIATDIGEISNLIQHKSKAAGILIPNTRNSDIFFELLYEAMVKMMNDKTRNDYAMVSKTMSNRFTMNKVGKKYLSLYETARSIIKSDN